MASYFHVLYERASSAHLQAHNHSDRHREDEELICKPGHQDILHIEQETSLSCYLNQSKISNKKNQPLGCHNSEVNFTVGGLFG